MANTDSARAARADAIVADEIADLDLDGAAATAERLDTDTALAGWETQLEPGAALEVERAFLTIPGIGHTRLNSDHGINVSQIISEAYRVGKELQDTLGRYAELQEEHGRLVGDVAAMRRVFGL